VAVVLPRGTQDQLARALSARVAIDWLHRPFTRCLVDNTPLRDAGTADGAWLPPDVQLAEARACPLCGRAYWAGSHHRRMLARLRAWRETATSTGKER